MVDPKALAVLAGVQRAVVSVAEIAATITGFVAELSLDPHCT